MYQEGKQRFYFYFFNIAAGGDDNGQDKSDVDAPDSRFPNVPTAVSLVAQEAAIEDVSNDCDPEMAKVMA